MRRPVAFVSCALGVGAAVLAAQQPPEQEPFRAAVDVIELDVSVLDKDRLPVPGLVASDFTVLEDGKPQRIVSVAYVEPSETDPAPSARMRFVTPDVAVNSLAERIGAGRLFAIVLDDMNLPGDDADLVIAAREAARHVVEQLAPSDQAAIVFTNDAGRTQDYTSDRAKLFDAIDQFVPNPPDWIPPVPRGLGPGGGDMPQRFAPVLMRTPCLRDQPAVPTLEAVTTSLAAVPGRRKTIVFIGVGLPVSFRSRDSCGAVRDEIVKDVFRAAQRANIVIHTVDPTGYDGYERYLELRRIRRGPPSGITREPPSNLRLLHDFMKSAADNTGGQAVVQTDAVLQGIDRIFAESSAYYLIGYESDRGAPDGKYHDIDVKVDRPGVRIRNRSGYWSPRGGSTLGRERAAPPGSFDPADAGLTPPPGVALRATAAAVDWHPAGAAGDMARGTADVVIALGVAWPPARTPVTDTLRIVRNVYDPDGRAGEPTPRELTVSIPAGSAVRREIVDRLSLPPGRYQVRFNVSSAQLARSGTVRADVDVPAFDRSALTLSGVVLGTGPDETDGGEEDLLPFVPTSERDFPGGETVQAFVRVFQAATGASDVELSAEIVDAGDRSRWSGRQSFPAAAFAGGRGAAGRFAVPLEGLESGPYLLSIGARRADGRTARRDVVFRVR